MKNVPQKLYLNVNNEDGITDFNELDHENITWSTKREFDTDIEYMRIVQELENPKKENIDKTVIEREALQKIKNICVTALSPNIYEQI